MHATVSFAYIIRGLLGNEIGRLQRGGSVGKEGGDENRYIFDAMWLL
jgi:hypothetical protein